MVKKENTEKKKKVDDKTVLIGKKPFMSYVKAVTMQFSEAKLQSQSYKRDEITIKARGKFINRAVDVALVTQRILIKQNVNLKVENIKIDSKEFENKEKEKPVRVSSIEITLRKK